MRCIVTGGAGFIGSNLALALESIGHEVAILDNFFSGNRSNLSGFEGEIIEQDIRKYDWFSSRADIIFHQAAITGMISPKDGSLFNNDVIQQVNFSASKDIFDYCLKRNLPLVYASSAAVYGKSPLPQREQNAGRPSNEYGRSKWLFDKFVSEQKNENLVVGLRYFNVFGPRERYKGLLASMVWQLMQQMLAGQRPRIFRFGEQRRDQVYVKDVIEATMLAAKAEEKCIVNVGSGEGITFNRVVAALNEALSTDLEPEYIENPYENFYQNETQADISLAKQKIGYEPKWKFEAAVKDYVLEETAC
jgi:ADP-L-glycero-D-manno-heptose 6-epimerase